MTAAVSLGCLAVAVRHLVYGAGVADEPYYIALAYRFIRGDVPCISETSLHQYAALLTVPVYQAYLSVVGSTQGIVLYGRVVYLAVLVLVLLAVARAIRGLAPGPWAVLVCLPLVFYAPMGISSLSYNSIAAMAFLLSCVWAHSALSSGGKRAAFGSGVAAAVTGIAYPPMLLVVVPGQLILAWALHREARPLRWMGLAGLAAGLSPIAILAVWVGPAAIWRTYTLTSQGAAQGGALAKLAFLATDTLDMVLLWPWTAAAAIVVLVAAVALRGRVRWLASGLIAITPVLVYAALRMQAPPGMMRLSLFVTAWSALSVVVFAGWFRDRGARRIMATLVAPAAAAAIVFSYSSMLGVGSAGVGLLPAFVASSVLMLWTAGVTPDPTPTRLALVAGALMVVLLAAGVGWTQWDNVFGDYPPPVLTARVVDGPWAAVFTTPALKAHLAGLQRDVGASGPTGRSVIGAPGDYLVTQGRIAMRTAWAPAPGPGEREEIRLLETGPGPDLIIEDRMFGVIGPQSGLAAYMRRNAFSVKFEYPGPTGYTVYAR
jgi:hypothetical protein